MTALSKWLVEKPLLYGGLVLIWHLDQEGESSCLTFTEQTRNAEICPRSLKSHFVIGNIHPYLSLGLLSRRKKAIEMATSMSL